MVGMSERGCADVCARCGCKEKSWKCVGEGPVGMSAWMRGRVRTVWVQGKGWKWVERRAGGHGCVRTVRVQRKSWKWVGRRTGGHERAWMGGRVQMVWGEGPVGMRERGCAGVCGWCGCKGKVGNGWGKRTGGHERGCANVFCRRRNVKWVGRMTGMNENGCAEVCRQWKWAGRRAGGHERAWMPGRVRTV